MHEICIPAVLWWWWWWQMYTTRIRAERRPCVIKVYGCISSCVLKWFVTCNEMEQIEGNI